MWVKIDDGAPLHSKLLAAGPEAAWLWICGLAKCNREATDGKIPKVNLLGLYPSDDWSKADIARLAARLVEVGLWHDAGDGWTVHDYADYQGEAMREARDERRKWEAERKARQRATAKAKSVSKESADLACLSRRDMGGTGGGTSPRDNPGTAPRDTGGTDAGLSQAPVPSRPVPSRVSSHEDTHSERVRAGTVEHQGIDVHEVVAILRQHAKGKVLVAADTHTLAALQRLLRDLSVHHGWTLATYRTLAGWYANGGGWRDASLGVRHFVEKQGLLAHHVELALLWEAAGGGPVEPMPGANAPRQPAKARHGPAPIASAEDIDADVAAYNARNAAHGR